MRKIPLTPMVRASSCLNRSCAGMYPRTIGASLRSAISMLREGLVNGERHNPETHIIPLLLQTALGERPQFEIFGTDYPTPDGTCLRDYVHVIDIAEAHILAMRKMDAPGFHVYNIGTGTSHSVQEVWKIAEEIADRNIKTRGSARRPGDPAVLCANPARLRTT